MCFRRLQVKEFNLPSRNLEYIIICRKFSESMGSIIIAYEIANDDGIYFISQSQNSLCWISAATSTYCIRCFMALHRLIIGPKRRSKDQTMVLVMRTISFQQQSNYLNPRWKDNAFSLVEISYIARQPLLSFRRVRRGASVSYTILVYKNCTLLECMRFGQKPTFLSEIENFWSKTFW